MPVSHSWYDKDKPKGQGSPKQDTLKAYGCLYLSVSPSLPSYLIMADSERDSHLSLNQVKDLYRTLEA